MAESLAAILEHIQAAGNLNLVAVVSVDGFLVDAAQTDEIDAEEFAAVATNGLMVAQAIGREIERGAIEGTIFEYEQGTVIINPLDEEVVLVLLAGSDANLGRLRLLARRYRDELVAAVGMTVQ